MDAVLKDYTGREAKDMYERVNAPARGVQAQAVQYEYEAKQAVAHTLWEMWNEGKLKEKSIAEVEQLLLQNSKTKEETEQIKKAMANG